MFKGWSEERVLQRGTSFFVCYIPDSSLCMKFDLSWGLEISQTSADLLPGAAVLWTPRWTVSVPRQPIAMTNGERIRTQLRIYRPLMQTLNTTNQTQTDLRLGNFNVMRRALDTTDAGNLTSSSALDGETGSSEGPLALLTKM